MRKIIILLSLAFGIANFAFGQNAQYSEIKADQSLRGSGRVNASTLGVEISIPLGSYPGRGINVPISLSYSSKVWGMKSLGLINGGTILGGCRSFSEPRYARNSASGWTTSLAVPYIEYVGKDNLFDTNGFPIAGGLCANAELPPDNSAKYIKRLVIHLPSGETHELRIDDTPVTFDRGSTCPPAGGFTCDPSAPSEQTNWNGTFYAVDGSNIKYVQDSTTATYRLMLADGSKYDFDGMLNWINEATVRKATKFTDRNGNFTSYNASTGVLTDTLGRTLAAPVGPSAPAQPTATPVVYSLPGMTGSYKFQWKFLKGSSAVESGLTVFEQDLKYPGDKIAMGPNDVWTFRAAGTYLFGSNFDSYVRSGNDLFNPIVLTEIELPTGQKYKFSYTIYGLIEKITYPTGGEEKFVHGAIAPLTKGDTGNVTDQTNFGVVNRKVYATAGTGTPYEWNYSAAYVDPSGYKLSITSPDQTLSERYLYQGTPCTGCSIGDFGYDNALAGMPYEERGYDSSNPRKLLSQKLTSWTKKTFSPYPVAAADWHPRSTQEESRIYDSTGSGVSTTATFEYEGDLNLRETPVLMKKSSQYAFVPAGSALPANPVRSSESTFLINDANYASVKQFYVNQNMNGLVTVSQTMDGGGQVVARSEMVYDEPLRSQGYRGSPTTAKAWDSTKGGYTSSSAYILTRARFDTYGNQYESTDAKGNTSNTIFDGTYQAFPIQVISPIPSDGTYGSNSAFVTTATFNPTTGLPLNTTDANGIETRIEYDTATLRPLNTKSYYQGTQVGSTAETSYNDTPGNYWVKNRTQIDTNKWAESISYFDGLGRAWKSEEVDSNGNIFVE